MAMTREEKLDAVRRIAQSNIDTSDIDRYLEAIGFMGARAAAINVVKAWQRLGSCEDEFEDFGLAQEACGEYADHLDSAIIALRDALGITA